MGLSRWSVLVFMLLFAFSIHGQMDSVKVVTYGSGNDDEFNDVVVYEDTLYIVGSTSVCGSENGLIAKSDTNLNLVSSYNFGADLFVEKFNSIEVHQDTLYVAGLTNINGSYEVSVSKFDKVLNKIDEVQLDFGGWTICNELKVSSSGKIVGVGKVLSQNGDWQAIVFCLNTDLELQWTFADGDDSDDEFYDLVFWNDSDIIATGYWTNSLEGDKDLLISKLTSNGQLEWHSLIGESNDDWAESIIVSKDTSLIMFGTTSSYTSVSEDTYLVKTDSNGVFQWSNLHQVQTPENVFSDNGIELLQLSNENILVFANLRSFVIPEKSNIGIFQTDKNGNWMGTQHVFGGEDDYVKDVYLTGDSSVYFCGSTSSYGYGGKESMLGKLPTVDLDVSYNSVEEFYNCFSDIQETEENQFEVYPNPFSDVINLSLPSDFSSGVLRVYNLLGEVIHVQEIEGSTTVAIQANFVQQNGLYILEVEGVESGIVRKKLIHE